ncbi:P-type conjugative transfer protein TrbJ [Neorhizobium alkalisoli]|uniref:P-type conjugative transfer protein TrbJ n=2 Tax=Neorhizobium alkalisoli TaxID=528178 RepID=A0A561QB74_9HYPH|nr:P-type conjugative transfer protein TrbJ [Neorhizobium alkalisoli]TWF47601.1 P-type conjugative transfer protein TrbJ [Neorhizobium alkalisoli]
MRKTIRAVRMRKVIAAVVLIGLTASAGPGLASGALTGATEMTQILNNGELISLVGQSGEQINNQITQITQLAEQIENQLKIYQNMLQNTARLPKHIWGEVEADLDRLRTIINQGQGIAFSMGNADDLLKQRFKSYSDLKTSLPNAASFSSAYQSWSDTNRDTIAGTLRAASLVAEQFDSEEDTMSQLRSMSQTADGQMKALQVGHEIAAQQVAQIQKLRGIVSQQATLIGTWLQSEQTQKDLAQARRETFFNADTQPVPAGQKMEPRW